MPHSIKLPKKLIEVALPLDAINEESARRKRKAPAGYPTTLHKWWAQRPVAAARAVIFGQLVNDPSWKWEIEHPDEIPPNNLKGSWAASRKRLFGIIGDLVKWENTANEEVLEKARAEIRRSWLETCELNNRHPDAAKLFDPQYPPALYDPFAGGGSIPMEAQRLGLEAYASDLNPVAVLINKAMIEIPPKFSGRSPVNAEARSGQQSFLRQWHGTAGMAEDVRHYGEWVRNEAQKQLGHLYPNIQITPGMVKVRPDLKQYVGKELPVVAWLWARTVKSPNPAFRHVDVPLASTFVLSTKPDKEVYVFPIVEGDRYRFTVKMAKPPAEAKAGTTAGKRAAFRCLLSGVPIDYNYIRSEAKAGRMCEKLMAVVAEGRRGRIFLSPTPEHEAAGTTAEPTWKPDCEIPQKHRNFQPPVYGVNNFGDLFTRRQLVALTTLSELVMSVQKQVRQDAHTAWASDDGGGLDSGGTGAQAYSEAIAVYLAFAIDRVADYGSAFATWRPKDSAMRSTLASQAIPMAWDFAEGSPLGSSSSGFVESVSVVARAIEFLCPIRAGKASQSAAQTQSLCTNRIVSTDPPYYDNISYADLSDFFYVWLRRTLRDSFPSLFATLAVPKAEELIAAPQRHGGVQNAEAFFLSGMTRTLHGLASQAHPSAPLTIYYAYKQSETVTESGTSSTGWETFLEAVNRAGLAVTGTWPMRTEGDNRQIGHEANALASSIVLVCRPRPENAAATSRRAFLRELNIALPLALDEMTKGAGSERSPVAPVDLSQAIVGPGMAVYSKYSAVLEADGTPMSVKTALQLINRFLAEDDFDHDTQFCLHWFEQNGWKEGRFSDADTLARAKGTSVDGVKHSGVLFATGGIVRLFRWSEYPSDWDPTTDHRLPVWEALHQLIRVFKSEGEGGAGAMLSSVEAKLEATRQLAYRLYTLCERAGWAEDARAYNEIITSWGAIESAASAVPSPKQATLFG